MADFARLHRTARFGQVLVTFFVQPDGGCSITWWLWGQDGLMQFPLNLNRDQWLEKGAALIDASTASVSAEVQGLIERAQRMAAEQEKAKQAAQAAASAQADADAKTAAGAWPIQSPTGQEEDEEPLPAPTERAKAHQALLRRVGALEDANLITKEEGASARVLIDNHVPRFSGKPTLTVEPDGTLVLRYVDRRTGEEVELECSDDETN